MSSATQEFRPGDAVRLRGKRAMTYVRRMMDDVDGGVELEEPLDRFRCWNVRDLERVPKGELG